MEYTTQMDAARKGIITKEMECVAAKEHMDINELVKLVACGQVIIPANKNHKCLDPNGIGSMLRTKINVNLGTSRDCVDLDMELDKVNNAVHLGTHRSSEESSLLNVQQSSVLFQYMMPLYIITRLLRKLLLRNGLIL